MSEIEFEVRRRYYWLLPLMWVIAVWVWCKKRIAGSLGIHRLSTNALLFDGLAPVCHEIRAGKASWKALSLIYNYQFRKPTTFGERLDNIWLMSPNAQAVRNRHKIATLQVLLAIEEIARRGRPVRLLSLAAGSAEGVMRAVRIARRKGIFVQCMLADNEESALEYALAAAKKFHIDDRMDVRIIDVKNPRYLRKLLLDFHPEIVEMMGLLDYLSDKLATSLITMIRSGLPAGGKFLTCNIMPNAESMFLKQVLDWAMIYRSGRKLRELVLNSEFDDVRVVPEPWMIHSVAIATVGSDGELLSHWVRGEQASYAPADARLAPTGT